jgi:hypothetical protein
VLPVRIRRLSLLGVALLSGLGFTIFGAGTAVAGGPGGSGSGGCSGITCWTQIAQYIQLSGSVNQTGPGNTGGDDASLPPPACWMQPFGDGQFTWNWWQNYARTGDVMVIPAYSQYVPEMQAKSKDGPGQGEWWTPVGNPLVNNNATCVAQLPLMEWVPPGQQPQEIAVIPPIDLARYAYAHMVLPTPTFSLNPQNKTEVNLPTFITNLGGTGQRQATAKLGNETSTVTAVAEPGTGQWISVSAEPSGIGTGYSNCTITGTHDSQAAMDAAKVGTPPDCGVLFQQPSTGTAHVQVQVTWQATWDNTLLGTPILANAADVGNVLVREIQSVNNNG